MPACVEFIVTFKIIITTTRQHCITSETTIFFESLGSSCLSVCLSFLLSVIPSISLSVYLTVYPYVRMEQHGSYCKDFHNIFFYFMISRNLSRESNFSQLWQEKLYIIWRLMYIYHVIIKGKGKGKVRPRTRHEGPEGEKRYSSILPLTSALDGVGG
jgi:hypothetical protein